MEYKYYKVEVKSGHVGKGKYYLNTLPIYAHNGKEAAEIARNWARVKHDHKDAVRSVVSINKNEFDELYDDFKHNPYNTCTNIQEQRLVCPDMYKLIYDDDVDFHNKPKYSNHHTEDLIKYKKRKQSLYLKNSKEELEEALLDY